MMLKNSEPRGFTLIELLVVIAIIGVLSSVVLASLNTARERARDARRLADMRQVEVALELYAGDHDGSYPIASPSYLFDITLALEPTYIPNVPEDPTRTAGYRYRYYTASPYRTYTFLLDMERDGDNGFCKINHGAGYSGWQIYPDCI